MDRLTSSYSDAKAPTTDDEARAMIRDTGMLGAESTVRLYNVRRKCGDSIEDAYERTLLTSISTPVLQNLAMEGVAGAAAELLRRA